MKQGKTHYTKRTRRSRTRRIGGAVLVFFALATVALVFAIYHAEPILRGRIMDTLSARFHSRVELPEFHVSVARLQVSGRGLKIFSKSDLNIHQPGIQPLITVDEFRFGAAIPIFCVRRCEFTACT